VAGGVTRPARVGQPRQQQHGNAAARDQPPERMRGLGETAMNARAQDGARKGDAERRANLSAGGGNRRGETRLCFRHPGHSRVGNGRIHHAETDPEDHIGQQQ